jgi:hypothetical protein
VKILTTKDYSLTELAKLAIKNRLYVAGWSLRSVYSHILNNSIHPKSQMAIICLDDVPVAVGIYIYEITRYQCMFFTRKAHRGKKLMSIAKKTLDTLISNEPKMRIRNSYATTIASQKCLASLKIEHSQQVSYY